MLPWLQHRVVSTVVPFLSRHVQPLTHQTTMTFISLLPPSPHFPPPLTPHSPLPSLPSSPHSLLPSPPLLPSPLTPSPPLLPSFPPPLTPPHSPPPQECPQLCCCSSYFHYWSFLLPWQPHCFSNNPLVVTGTVYIYVLPRVVCLYTSFVHHFLHSSCPYLVVNDERR